MTARIVAAVLAASACLLWGAPSALAAAPAFKLTATSQPTNFLAGSDGGDNAEVEARPIYSVIATNVGSAPTSGAVTFTDTLPPGLTPILDLSDDVTPAPGQRHRTNRFKPCELSGQTVTCTDPKPLLPGEWIQFYIRLAVAADAPPSVTNEMSIEGGGAAEARTSTTTAISPAVPPFDFLAGPSGLSAAISASGGQPATQAGSHPYELAFDFGFPSAEAGGGLHSGGALYSAGHLRSITARLPRGMVTNPRATTLCTEAQFMETGLCPDASQVGTVTVLTEVDGSEPVISPLYNMVAPPGSAAELAFEAVSPSGILVHLLGGVNSAGEYELGTDTGEILAREINPILGFQAQLWGDPSDASHDSLRGKCALEGSSEFNGGASPLCPLPERSNEPFLTMPSSCRETLKVTAIAADWEEPQLHGRGAEVEDSLGNPTGTDGCNQLEFAPEVEAKPTTNLADAPSGLDFKLHVPQSEDIEGLATANFKDVKVTLPEGMAVSPSSANGLGACSSAQIGLSTPIGQMPIHFTEDPASCPQAAKLGSVEVNTPLLDQPLSGAVYLAKPFDNPFGSLIAIYLDIEDPVTGTVSKLAGRVDPDPQTGRLTTIFRENPELPIEDVKLSFFKGPRAPLRTPVACGTYSTNVDVTPWSAPEGIDANLSDSFATSVAAAGTGACPASEAGAPNNPAFSAGTIAPQAGAYSPFVLKLSREDGTQRLTGLDTTLPKGLIGKLAGISLCSDAQIAKAQSRSRPNEGILEQQNPSCPASSEVGSLDVASGAGITPMHVAGHAYLAGPYKGAPISTVFITPALAGPFDLGTVVVRAALRIDPETSQVRAVSDPLPSILDGIPLDIRSVAVKLARPEFTLNPTNCDPMAVLGTATSALGSIASLTSPFQVGGCSSLGFKPKLAFALKGATKRTGHPALKAVVSYPKGAYANVAKAQVTLPKSEFLDQSHIKTICTRVQFAAHQCPAGSVYGHATAITPLLDGPLSGPVYLRSSSHQLPDLAVELKGQIDVVIAGRIDTINGGIRTTFEAVPDAPISKFVLTMQGAKKGLLVNSTDLCKQTNRATALFDGQNGKTYDAKPVLAVSCKSKGHKSHKGHKGKAQR